MTSIASAVMEEYETPRGRVPLSPQHDHELIRASAEAQADAVAIAEIEAQVAPVLRESPKRTAKAKIKACVRGKETSVVVTFRGSPPPDSHLKKWVGQQDASEIPNGGRLLDSPPGFPDGLLVIEDDQRRQRIIVPSEQRERLIK
jgi:hypothetical protein